MKPGIKTSEFYVALVSNLVGLGTLFGIFSQPEAETLIGVLETLISAAAALALAIIPLVKYINGRGGIKAAAEYAKE